MLPPKGRKHACEIAPLDILCSLPENIMDDILVRLPLRDAVRTSILSKKWRYKWCSLPELTLDLTHLTSITNVRSMGGQEVLIPPEFQFTNIIYHILTLHTGPIAKFSLSFSYNLSPCPSIDNLIYFLSNNDIQHLVLKLPSLDGPYKLPLSIFTCLQLRHLTLQNCLLFPPQPFIGFDRLTNLKLCGVIIPSIFLETLISFCPLLEQLELDHIVVLDVLVPVVEINAPKLRSFNFEGEMGSVSLKYTPLLTKLSLLASGFNVEPQKCDIAKFFGSFSSVEHLQLNSCILKFWAAGAEKLPTRLPFDVNSVKSLYLSDFFLGEEDAVSVALCLIRSFPYLRRLQILVSDEDVDIPALECLEVEAFSDLTFNHLRRVELISTLGTKPEMQLMKLLLAKSPVLVRMLVDPCLDDERVDQTLKISAELNSFRRASPEVEVVFNC